MSLLLLKNVISLVRRSRQIARFFLTTLTHTHEVRREKKTNEKPFFFSLKKKKRLNAVAIVCDAVVCHHQFSLIIRLLFCGDVILLALFDTRVWSSGWYYVLQTQLSGVARKRQQNEMARFSSRQCTWCACVCVRRTNERWVYYKVNTRMAFAIQQPTRRQHTNTSVRFAIIKIIIFIISFVSHFAIQSANEWVRYAAPLRLAFILGRCVYIFKTLVVLSLLLHLSFTFPKNGKWYIIN